MTPTEPRTEAGRVLLRYLDRIWQMALDGEALSVYEDERHEDHQHDVAAILAIEAEALAEAESQREALLTGPQLAAVREAVEYRLFGEDVPNRAVLSRAADRLAALKEQPRGQ
jgi:hypothetical protein